jgi:phosphopantetheinyl transferase
VAAAGCAGLDDPHARQELFVALWCMKEAVVKAKGTGINAPPGLKGFTVGEHKTLAQTYLCCIPRYTVLRELSDAQEVFCSMVGCFRPAGKVPLGREVPKQELRSS